MTSEFSYSQYRDMLQHALDRGFTFLFFTEFEPEQNNRTVLLRHDIDVSLEAASVMARIEKEMGIKATYFIRLNSTFYNPFGQRDYPLLREIRDLGHDIGLHFDPKFYVDNGLELIEGIRREREILSTALNMPIMALSQHRPFSLGMSNFDDERGVFDYYAYAPRFTEGCKYISESCQRWREGDLSENIDQYSRLQVLIHPAWWGEDHKNWEDILRTLQESMSGTASDKVDILIKRYRSYLDQRSQGPVK